MKQYQAGDKVQSPLGLGIVIEEQKDMAIGSYIIYLGKPYIKSDYNYEVVFNERELKPYKTAHEKLIEKGFEEFYRYNERYYILDNDEQYIEIYIDIKGVNYYVPNNEYVDLELSRILTQYLEELK